MIVFGKMLVLVARTANFVKEIEISETTTYHPKQTSLNHPPISLPSNPNNVKTYSSITPSISLTQFQDVIGMILSLMKLSLN